MSPDLDTGALPYFLIVLGPAAPLSFSDERNLRAWCSSAVVASA